MRTRHRAAALLLAALMALFCSGCMATNVEELYSLPRMSEEYVQLQALISRQIDDGAEYAAPVGGSYRQSIQLQDLDGDGKPEALAFLADSAHTPNICIYRQNAGGDYYLYINILGEGSAVSSVEYADLNGDDIAELIIAWQISGDIRLLTVYALSGEEPVKELLNADCGSITVCDLNGDGAKELVDLRINYGGESSLVHYAADRDGHMESTTASLSSGITGIRRVRSGYLADGTAALFVESDCEENNLITDVFTAPEGELNNITLTARGRSDTVRSGGVFSTDINGDRAMEIPESAGDTLKWYGLDASGRKTLVATTYHDYEDGWYLALTEGLTGNLSIARKESASGEEAVAFSVNGKEALVLYTLTGENRLDRAEAGDRFLIREAGTTAYAAEIISGNITEEEIESNFNLIYSEWQTGDL